jgi:hypothetical protein
MAGVVLIELDLIRLQLPGWTNRAVDVDAQTHTPPLRAEVSVVGEQCKIRFASGRAAGVRINFACVGAGLRNSPSVTQAVSAGDDRLDRMIANDDGGDPAS